MRVWTPTTLRGSLPHLKVEVSDPRYVFPDQEWFLKTFLPFWDTYRSKAGLAYAEHGFDCDDFAKSFASQLSLSARRSATGSGVGVALLTVMNTASSLGIGPGRHMLNLVGTEAADGIEWLVVEPQNSRYVSLKNYHTARPELAAF